MFDRKKLCPGLKMPRRPAIEQTENAPLDRLQLRYATGEVVILGRFLHRLAQMIQRGELENIRPLGDVTPRCGQTR